ILQWSDEMTRLLLDLITLQKQAENSKGKSLSEQGKQNMFPITLNWNKVKNKLDNLKKQYELYRKITFGAIGLGFNPKTGSFDAPKHWWIDKIKAYREASKLRSNPLRCIPLLHVESWQPRRGAHSRAPPEDLSENESLNNNADEREDPTQNDFLHPGE
ncbi:unnamed protein product, partial [Thlaspi arvense]